MQHSTAKYIPSVVSALLLWVVLYFMFPHYRYYIDPDGTSYLTVSARYAAGDYFRAINGLWSPWGCWLTALVIKAGLSAVPASIIVNAAGGTGFLLLSDSLFLRFNISRQLRWLFCGTLAAFLCFAIFWQSFDDLWQCFFLLSIVRIMLVEDYKARHGLWMLIGILGALSYFAKAYSLQFFILNTLCCSWFLSGRNIKLWVKMVVVPVAVMLVCAFPWIYALHYKYGIWATSNAGAMIISWFLVGHPNWKEGIDVLVPPIYNNSVYYWEDPYYVNGATSHFLDSLHFFGYQIIRCGYNGLVFALCLLRLSVFFPLLNLYLFARIAMKKRFAAMATEEWVLYLTMLLLPTGYLLIHVESRYLWCTLPLGIIVAERFVRMNIAANKRTFAIGVFALSLLVYPVWHLGKLYNEGKEEYNFSLKLQAAGLRGIDLVSNLHPRILSKVAYFSGNRFYMVEKQRPAENVADINREKQANTLRLVNDIKKYGIKYYLHAPDRLKNPGFERIFFDNLKDSTGVVSFRPVLQDRESGMTLYEMSE